MTIYADPIPTTLRPVRYEIPKHLFKPSRAKATATLASVAVQVVVATAVAFMVWTKGWWFLAPVSWAIGSVASTALFVAGHDCGHKSFLASDRAMKILGHVLHAPVLYPFWAWKYSHDAHHRHTNLLDRGEGIYYDNAWTPYSAEQFRGMQEAKSPVVGIYKVARWIPPIGSLLHLLWVHWVPTHYRKGKERNRVMFSMAVTAATAIALSFALWTGFGSPLAVLHFFVIPALGFQLWMALYTYLHHTTPDVTLHRAATWNPFLAQMDGTVNVLAPRWISFLHFNIDVHIPHHVSTNIPSYHLRAANAALRAGSWGQMMREHKLTVRYVADQIRACHLWGDERNGYVRFDELTTVETDSSR